MATKRDKTSTECYAVRGTGMLVTCYIGDITDASTVGVVTGTIITNKKQSKVTEALIKTLGPTYETNRLLEKSCDPDAVCVIPTGKCDSMKYVIHAPIETCRNPAEWNNYTCYVYQKVWETADKYDIISLTLPILGSGTAQAPLGLAIEALVYSAFNCNTRKLKDIRIVSMNEDVHNKVKELCEQYHIQSTYTENKHETSASSNTVSSGGKKTDHFAGTPQSLNETPDQYQTTYQQDYQYYNKTRKTESHISSFRASVKDHHICKPLMNKGGGITIHNNTYFEQNGGDIEGAGKDMTQTGIWSDPTRSGFGVADSGNSMHDTRRNHHETTTMTSSKKPDSSTSQCAICMDVIQKGRKLEKCGHEFCEQCIDDSFKHHKPVCPVCNTIYGVVTGNQPDGLMVVQRSSKRLTGYPGCGTIVITYEFYDGVQKSEHPHPGRDYQGTRRVAFLPDDREGQKVCRLLRTAFNRKLTFTIGRSSTTGIDDVVTWNDIHHKTSMHGGEQSFGYPDSTYLSRVQDELTSKGVTEETEVVYENASYF